MTETEDTTTKTLSDEVMVFILFDLFQVRLEGLKGNFKHKAKMYYNDAIKVNSRFIKHYNSTLKQDTEVGLSLSADLLLLLNEEVNKIQKLNIDEINNLIKQYEN